ncbi:unnamed protein product [Dicrocoelium dendriticum]|nr:unnamed protein product [Dicrocoelium dendriticum]
MRVDEKTKEILEMWPLTRIRRWAAGPNLFTLDFGQHNPDGNYAMQTTEGEQIGQLISGYIDIILRRQRSKHTTHADGDEENTIVEENVTPSKAQVISSATGTLSRARQADEAHIAQDGILHPGSRYRDFSEIHLATRGETVIERTVDGAHVGSGVIVNRDGAIHDGWGDRRRQGYQVIDLSQPKRALLSRIDFGLRTIKEAAEELDTPVYSDDEALRGEDSTTMRWRAEALEQARQGVWSHLGAMTMATGHLVSCLQSTPSERPTEDNRQDFDYTNVDASLVSIGMNIHGLMQYVRLFDQIGAADGRESQAVGLRQAAQALSDAFLELMRAAVPASPLDPESETDKAFSPRQSSASITEPGRHGPDRAALLEAASHVGDASRKLLQLISQPTVHAMNSHVEYCEASEFDLLTSSSVYPSVVDWEARDRLLSATKTIANRMAQLVKTAKQGAMDIGQEASDLSTKNPSEISQDAVATLRATQARLVHSATVAGKSTSRLVTCAKVVVCTMEQPESQDQLLRTAKEVGVSANAVSGATDDLIRMSSDLVGANTPQHDAHLQLGDDLHEGVLEIHSGLDSLVDCLRAASIQAHQDPVVSTLLSASTQLPASIGDGVNLVNKASTLASAASSLMSTLRSEASLEQSRTTLSSVEAAKRADLLEADIRRLLTAAQACADGNLQSLEHQQMIVAAAERLVSTSYVASGPIIRARLTQGLEFATRLTAANAGPLATVGGEVVRISQGNTYKLATNLEQLQKRVIPQVNMSCSGARSEPYNAHKQADLLSASQTLMQCLEELLKITDALMPTIPDSGLQTAFCGAARNTRACLTDLRTCYADSESVLCTESPSFDALTISPTHMKNDEQWFAAMSKINRRLDDLNEELRSNTTRLLPDETLDSVCVTLWGAVSRFNRSFPPALPDLSSEAAEQPPDQPPTLISRLISHGDTPPSFRGWQYAVDVLDELLERLSPLVRGIRGLVAFLTVSAHSQTLDYRLARVLLVSHGLSTKRQSNLSSCSSPGDQGGMFGAGHEEQAQSTAEAMLQHLLSIGESCLTHTGQLIAWVMRSSPIDPQSDETHQAAALADQLVTSVNAVLGYVPGEVIVRRLIALLDDVEGMLKDAARHPSSAHHVASPNSSELHGPYNRQESQEIYQKLAESACQLSNICVDSFNVLTGQKQEASTKAIGSDSQVIRLAHVADRITCALAEVVRAAGGRGAPLDYAVSLLHGLVCTGQPLVAGLRYAMRTVDTGSRRVDIDYEGPCPEPAFPHSLLLLRDWAVELGLQSQARATVLNSPDNELDTNPLDVITDPDALGAVLQVRHQCDSAIRRVKALIRPPSTLQPESRDARSRSTSPAYCPIRVPTIDQTFPECLRNVHLIDQDIQTYTKYIPTAAAERNTDAFVSSVKAVAQATCQLLQSTNQAAYLISVAHPASRPGRTGRLANSDQLTALHDHIVAVRKGASELGLTDVNATPDGLPSLELMNIATNVASRATQLCQCTRPLLSDCKTTQEKRTLAEALERVARAAAAVFRSTQTIPASDTNALLSHLKSGATQLEEAVDQYADVLFRAAGGCPAQLAEEALALQAPILKSGQTVVKRSMELLEVAQHFITDGQSKLDTTSAVYTRSRQSLLDSIHQLLEILLSLAPGVDVCNAVQADISELLSQVDNAALNTTSSEVSVSNSLCASLIENTFNLIKSSVQQVEQQCLESVENWRRGHWELMSHGIHLAGSYVRSLVKECVQCTTAGLSLSSDQAELLSMLRTVLEAMQQLIGNLNTGIHTRSFSNLTAPLPALDFSHQLKQACKELLARVDTVAALQGGLSWHISSITTACSKLDDIVSSSNGVTSNAPCDVDQVISLPASFVQHHTDLGHQSRVFADSAVHLAQISSGRDSSAVSSSVASLAQLFVYMTDTVQSIACALLKQPCSETGPLLARRLCQVTQALGAACTDFIRAPGHAERFNELVNKLEGLKATLQSCSRGADACATAAANISRLAADLDTAALFARAGTPVDPVAANGSTAAPFTRTSVAVKQHAFQSAQEAAMHAAKGIVEDMRTLIKNTATSQDALAVSAQNCLLRAKELTEAVKCATSRTVDVPRISEATTDSCVESQVQLLTAARDVANGLVRLLYQGKSVSAASYALEAWGDRSENGSLSQLLTSHQRELNETAVSVVESISTLSRALRNLSDLLNFSRPPTAPSPTPSTIAESTSPPAVPPKRISLVGSLPSGKPLGTEKTGGADLSGKASVNSSLTSVLSVLDQFTKRLGTWSVQNGCFQRPDTEYDAASEEQNALCLTTTPQQLIAVSHRLTQAVSKANSATGSGKLSDIALAGDLIRRAAEDLIHTLPLACQSALACVRNEHQPSNGDVQLSSHDEDGGIVEEDSGSSLAAVEITCNHALAGTCNTICELKQLVTHMAASLDSGPASPASVQVTLAMRRLRETVHEIIESATLMPGGRNGTLYQPPVTSSLAYPVAFRNRPPPSASNLPPHTLPKPPHRTSSLWGESPHQDEVEQSIAAANATAADAASIPLQKELSEMTDELERSVLKIGRLHSKHSSSTKKSVRFTTTVLQEEPSSTTDEAITVSPLTTSASNSQNLDGVVSTDSSEDIDTVLAASQHVIRTTLSLMYWAAAAQRELVQQGRLKPIDIEQSSVTEPDSQWAQGLISAARYVAAAANYVVESARAMVSVRTSVVEPCDSESGAAGKRKPEALICAAQTTAGCTAQLVVACVAKADPTSRSCIGLRQAAASVKRATDNLVRIVQSSSTHTVQPGEVKESTTRSFDNLNTSVVASMRQVIETKSSIAAKQKELDNLHTQLKHIHQDQYKSHAV